MSDPLIRVGSLVSRPVKKSWHVMCSGPLWVVSGAAYSIAADGISHIGGVHKLRCDRL